MRCDWNRVQANSSYGELACMTSTLVLNTSLLLSVKSSHKNPFIMHILHLAHSNDVLKKCREERRHTVLMHVHGESSSACHPVGLRQRGRKVSQRQGEQESRIEIDTKERRLNLERTRLKEEKGLLAKGKREVDDADAVDDMKVRALCNTIQATEAMHSSMHRKGTFARTIHPPAAITASGRKFRAIRIDQSAVPFGLICWNAQAVR